MAENLNTFGASMNKALKDDGDDFLNTALRKWKFNSKYVRNQRLFAGLRKQQISRIADYIIKIKDPNNEKKINVILE